MKKHVSVIDKTYMKSQHVIKLNTKRFDAVSHDGFKFRINLYLLVIAKVDGMMNITVKTKNALFKRGLKEKPLRVSKVRPNVVDYIEIDL